MVEVLSVTSVPRVSVGRAPKAAAPLQKVVANVGREGTWRVDRAFKLRQILVPIVQGNLELDLSRANTALVVVDQNVHTIRFVNLPPAGQSIRLQVYLEQDAHGHWAVEGWPPSIRTAGGIPPDFSYEPGRRDSFVLDTFDGGETVHLNLVGLNYRPPT